MALTALKDHLEYSMLPRLERKTEELFDTRFPQAVRAKWLIALRASVRLYKWAEKEAAQLKLLEQSIAKQHAAIYNEQRRLHFISADFQDCYDDFDPPETDATWEWVSGNSFTCIPYVEII